MDGQSKPARLLHPKTKHGSLVSFNDPATYCGHFSSTYNVDALPAQIGNEEAEKYAKAMEWLVNHSSVRFGDSTNCIWVDQAGDSSGNLDRRAHQLAASQGMKSVFSRGKAKKGQGQTLADSADLIEALRRFRNAQKAGYRNKRFYLLSVLLRNKGRHAVLGGFIGTLGELEDNTELFLKYSTVRLPKGHFAFKEEARDFCPTLMDILDAAGVKSQKKKKLVWDREVIEVIVQGRPLPPDLCRLVVLKAIQQKHREQSKETRKAYRELLAIAAARSPARALPPAKPAPCAWTMPRARKCSSPGRSASRRKSSTRTWASACPSDWSSTSRRNCSRATCAATSTAIRRFCGSELNALDNFSGRCSTPLGSSAVHPLDLRAAIARRLRCPALPHHAPNVNRTNTVLHLQFAFMR